MRKKHGIKSLLFTTALVTSCSVITMSADASEITPSTQLTEDENLSVQEQIEQNTVLKDVTIEEIYNAVAEGRNISYEEAKKAVLDDARTTYYQNNPGVRTFAPVSEAALEATVAAATKHLESWYYILNEKDGAQCWVRYGALVELGGKGSFTYITKIVDGTAFLQAAGSGNHTYSPAYLHATLVDGNRIRIQSSGNIESTVSKSHGASYSSKGFSLSVTGSDTQTWRKVLTLDKQIKLHE